jgi:hypothetical protein
MLDNWPIQDTVTTATILMVCNLLGKALGPLRGDILRYVKGRRVYPAKFEGAPSASAATPAQVVGVHHPCHYDEGGATFKIYGARLVAADPRRLRLSATVPRPYIALLVRT